jgi:hypothetical protein
MSEWPDRDPDSLLSRIHRARLAEAPPLGALTDEAANYIISAANDIPVSAINFLVGGTPQVGELWRVGRKEALLVWVRRIFDDGIVDAIPVVLDVELADEGTLLIPADATPIGVELAAMTHLRTHLSVDVFLNFICRLDIANSIEEVVQSAWQGRPSVGVPVGLPVLDSADQRIEYRAAIRDVLAHLSTGSPEAPSAASQEGDD